MDLEMAFMNADLLPVVRWGDRARPLAAAFALSGLLAGIVAILWRADRFRSKTFIAAKLIGLRRLQGTALNGLLVGNRDASESIANQAASADSHLLVSIFKVFAANVKAISIDARVGTVSYAARNRVLAWLG